MSVLLVEDDPSIAIVIRAALEDEGLEVTGCDTIAERDKLLARTSYSALVTDVMLPDGDGIETLARVREHYPDMPVVILSARRSAEAGLRPCRVRKSRSVTGCRWSEEARPCRPCSA